MIQQIPKELKRPFQKFIEALLNAHNLLEKFYESEDFHVNLRTVPYMPLSIEHHGNMLAVGHYYKQSGDMIADPDVQFDLPMWVPTNMTDGMGYTEIYSYNEEGKKVGVRPRAKKSVESFVNGLWAKNLRAQKWIEESVIWDLRINEIDIYEDGKICFGMIEPATPGPLVRPLLHQE